MIAKKYLPHLCLVTALLPAANKAAAATVAEDMKTLSGAWEGQAKDGTNVALQITAGSGDMAASGSLRIDGGAFAGTVDFNMLCEAKRCFLVPGKTLFDAESSEAYSVERTSGGAYKFIRLVRAHGDGPAFLQTETIEIGRTTHAGTRTLKLTRGGRRCADDASTGGKLCGDAAAETVALSKAKEA